LILRPTPIADVRIVELDRHMDERGFFARTWCREEFRQAGIDVEIVQASVSHNRLAGTLRGLHFAWPPSHEGKLVRCERGRVLDVIVDLRPDSPSFLAHFAVELDDDRRTALYIPPGVAHGFQTLVDACDVYYMMTDFYRPELAAGVRYDDPRFGIAWPRAVTTIVERDRTYPLFDQARHCAAYAAAARGAHARP
jgi:dTDP-4-dehydrorhamnose 3,5-epimerase